MSLERLLEIKESADQRERELERQKEELVLAEQESGVKLDVSVGELTPDEHERLQRYKGLGDDVNVLFREMEDVLVAELQKSNELFDIERLTQQNIEEPSESEADDFIQTEEDRKMVRINNLDRNALSEDVKNACEVAGRVRSVEIRKGYAFVEFETEEEARNCLINYNIMIIKGRQVKIDQKKTSIKKTMKVQ